MTENMKLFVRTRAKGLFNKRKVYIVETEQVYVGRPYDHRYVAEGRGQHQDLEKAIQDAEYDLNQNELSAAAKREKGIIMRDVRRARP